MTKRSTRERTTDPRELDAEDWTSAPRVDIPAQLEGLEGLLEATAKADAAAGDVALALYALRIAIANRDDPACAAFIANVRRESQRLLENARPSWTGLELYAFGEGETVNASRYQRATELEDRWLNFVNAYLADGRKHSPIADENDWVDDLVLLMVSASGAKAAGEGLAGQKLKARLAVTRLARPGAKKQSDARAIVRAAAKAIGIDGLLFKKRDKALSRARRKKR